MENTSVLTKKTFVPLKSENEKLGLFSNQVDTMREDFETMKRAREEARKELEARFLEVHRKIQKTKDFIAGEGKRTNDTLLAFQTKFQTELQTNTTYFQKLHDENVIYIDGRFTRNEEEAKRVDKKIDEEREERLRQSDEVLKEIKNQLETLFITCAEEKKERIEGEKMILSKLEESATALKEKMAIAKAERIANVQELRAFTDQELQTQQQFNEDFHTKTIDEFTGVVGNVQMEMDNRFDHQEQIIDNLSKLVNTLQDTLKVIGGRT